MSQGLEALIARSRAGDRAAGEQLIVENSGLIWSIARRYFGRGVDPDDLYQLGCLGFLKAVEGYDTAFGTQFSTYAVPKIQALCNILDPAWQGLKKLLDQLNSATGFS